jgi:ActR/RegA family two-component response regulator
MEGVAGGESALAGRSILVIDGETALCESLARRLTLAGATVRTAASSTAALALLEAAVFDLALVDKRLGPEDGVALIGKLRGREPAMASVIMTGFASVEDSLAALDAGAVGYLLKPFDPLDAVIVELEGILQREERRRRATIPPASAMSSIPPRVVLLALPREPSWSMECYAKVKGSWRSSTPVPSASAPCSCWSGRSHPCR